MIEQTALQVLNALREPLLLLDGNLRVRFANTTFHRVFQATPEQAVGRSLVELGNGHWNIPRLLGALHRILAEGLSADEFDVDREFEGMGVRGMRLRASALVVSGGERLVLLAIEDVTDSRVADSARDRHAQELERSNEALSQFAGMASHDLREPIRKMRSYAELLAESAGSKLDVEETEHLRRIISASDRMRRLVDSMLALSRVSRGEARITDVDLGAIAREAAADLGIRVDELSATIEVEAMPTVQGDAALLRLVFQNLIENALKFARPGHPPVIHISAVRRTSFVDVQVRDNGGGFDPSESQRIFEPFHRLHSRQSIPGNGMGLAICRRVADRHGGSLTARSTTGAGSTFVLSLPHPSSTESAA